MLENLARIAFAAAVGRGYIDEGELRKQGVTKFVGIPTRALSLLRWAARMSIEEGVRALTRAFGTQVTDPGCAAEFRP